MPSGQTGQYRGPLVLPLSFAFAALGRAGLAHPGLALAASALAPPLLWLLLRPVLLKLQRRSQASEPDIHDL